MPGAPGEKLHRSFYESELAQLQLELVKMQYWIKGTGFRLIVIFDRSWYNRVKLPPRKLARAVERPPIGEQFFVPNHYR